MTDVQIRECFGIESSAPDRVLRNDDEILQSIKNNIGFSKIFDDVCVNDVLQEIRQEISDFEEEVYHEPNTDYKAYASVRYCLEIIDKHIKEIEDERIQ